MIPSEAPLQPVSQENGDSGVHSEVSRSQDITPSQTCHNIPSGTQMSSQMRSEQPATHPTHWEAPGCLYHYTQEWVDWSVVAGPSLARSTLPGRPAPYKKSLTEYVEGLANLQMVLCLR